MGILFRAYCLGTASIGCLLSITLLGISYSTDNWLEIYVDRPKLLDYSKHHSQEVEIVQSLKYNQLYFDRIKGIFRLCFPNNERPEPPDIDVIGNTTFTQDGTYLNPVDDWCSNVDYYLYAIPDDLVPPFFSPQATAWLHISRCCVISFAAFFLFSGLACIPGIIGCWKMTADHLFFASLLMLVSSICGGAGMGFWHGAQFYEVNRVFDEDLELYITWPDYLKENTTFQLGWSYILCWIAIGLSLVSCLMLAVGGLLIKKEAWDKRRDLMRINYLMPVQHYGRWTSPYKFAKKSASRNVSTDPDIGKETETRTNSTAKTSETFEEKSSNESPA